MITNATAGAVSFLIPKVGRHGRRSSSACFGSASLRMSTAISTVRRWHDASAGHLPDRVHGSAGDRLVMSGGVSLPRYTVSVSQRPNTTVVAQGRPVVASVTVRGQQGAQGIQGAPGANGYAKRFGNHRLNRRRRGDAVRAPGRRVGSPDPEPDTLGRQLQPAVRPVGQLRFLGQRGRPPASVLSVTCCCSSSATPSFRSSGRGLRFSVRPGDDVNFEFGPDPIALTADAGQMQPGSETFAEQCGPGSSAKALSSTSWRPAGAR